MPKLTSVTDYQIRALIKCIFNVEPLKIQRNNDYDSIEVFIETEWETGDVGRTEKIRDMIELTKDGLNSADFPLNADDRWTYQQWLVAVRRHRLFEHNPFAKAAVQD